MKAFASPLKHYRCTVEALSPLHIGAAEPLPACRYALGDEKGAVLKASHILRLLDDGCRPDRILEKPSDLSRIDDDAILYPLKLPPLSRRLNKEAHPFIRDAFGHPYLPGSSLKGMFRQALLVSAVCADEDFRRELARHETIGDTLDLMNRASPENIGAIRKKNWNRINFMERAFRSLDRPAPQNDLLRGLRVGDAFPLDATPLSLQAIDVFTAKGDEMVPLSPGNPPIFRETLQTGQRFAFDLALDEAFLQGCENEVRRKGRRLTLRNGNDLLAALQDQSALVAALEKSFLRSHGLAELWRESYETDDGHWVVVRLGWGCGWLGHSLFPALRYGPEAEETPGSPRSRRLIVGEGGKPRDLLGWAKVKIDER